MRGGRMTKWKGQAASYAPNVAEIVGWMSSRALPLSLASVLAIGAAAAADRYWDPNGTAVGRGGSGTWNLTSAFWSPNGDGVSGPYSAWNNSAFDNAIFGGTTAGTVTLTSPITVNSLTFETPGYILTGGTLTLAGANPTISTIGTNTGVTIDSVIGGTAGLTKSLAGVLRLNGVNTFSGGINVTAGTLVVNGDAALGAASNGVTLAAGAGLNSSGALSSSRVVTLSGGQATIAGAGVGSARFTGAGGLNVNGNVTLNNNVNNYTGATAVVNGGTLTFTSIGDVGTASALGAPTDAASGTISLGVGSSTSAYAVYTGTGDSSNRNWRLGSWQYGTSGITNQGTGILTLTGDIASAHTNSSISVRNVVFTAATADLELLGTISSNVNGVGVVFSGGGTNRSVTVTGSNTFGGVAAIQNVTVRANTLKDVGTASALGTGANGNVSISNGTLAYTGTGDSSNRDFALQGSAVLANDGTGSLALSGGVGLAATGTNTLTLGGSFTGTNTVSGVISGNGGLVSNGSGTWLLTGANTYTGTVRVDSGTLVAGNAQAFSTPNGAIVNGGKLDLNGFDTTFTSLSGTGGSVALNDATITVNGSTNSSYGGSITGSGDLLKRGTGTLTLSGANTYTGSTTINGGAVVLDFSASGAPTSDILSSASTLNMVGGVLTVTGAAGKANTQTFSGVNVAAGNNRIGATSGTGGSLTLNLGAINRTGGLIDFTLPTSGSITTTSTVLGGWATVNGSDYAKVVSGKITAFAASDYTGQDNASLWANGQFITDDDGHAGSFYNTVNGSVQLGGLRYTQAAASTFTIGSGQKLGIDGTIIVAATVGNNNQTITGGSITGSAGGGILGLQQNGGGNFTIASTIVDNGGATGFTKAGSGTVTLSGANTYTGATTLSGGRLQITSLANAGFASSIGAASTDASNLVLESGTLAYTGGADAKTDRGFTLVNGGAGDPTIEVNTWRTVEFSGLVTSPDDAGLTKTGWGTLVLSNSANNYVGVTTVTGSGSGYASTLSVNTLANGGGASGIGAAGSDAANLVLSAGGRLQYTGGNVAIDRGFTLGTGGGRIDVAQAGTTLTISGTALGAGGLTKEGAGTLVLSGANTYAGDTVVDAGTLRAGSTQAFGPGNRYMTVNSGGTLELGGFNITAASLIGGGTVDLGSNTFTTSGGNGTFTGRITGTGGYTRSGGYTQVLSGCNNNYTGATTISGGSLSVDCLANGGVASGIGAATNASANLVFNSGTLTYTGGTTATDRGFTLQANTGAISVSNAATTLTFSGQVVGAGALRKDGAGTLILSGSNTYTGATTITGGTLRAGSSQAFGAAAAMVLNNTAGVTLDLAGYNTSVAYLQGGGATGGVVNLNGANLTLTNGNSTAGVTFAGKITGTGNLIKGGTQIQRLSGCDTDYSGSTTINGGTLEVTCLADGGQASSIGASSAAASNLVINGGALSYVGTGGSTDRRFTLGASGGNALDASGTGAINFTSNAAITFASANTAQTLTLTGTNTADNKLAAQITNNGTGVTSLTKTGTGTWILTNPASTYTGVTTINGGVLGVDKLADGGLASSLGASSAAASNLVIGNGSTLRYTGSGDTTNRLFTLSAGVTFIESSGTGAIVFTDTGPVTLAGANQDRTIALGGTNAGNNTLAGSIGNAGTGVTTLAKNDSGTWALTGNNTYTGYTVINAGKLKIGNGGTTGSIVSNVINGGTLAFDRSDVYTYNGVISGTGKVEQAGSGTTVLTANHTYTGGTTITNGTLQLGNGGASGSVIGNIVDDGILAFNRSDSYTFGNVVSGSGKLSQIGTGTTILTGTNTYTGGTTITNGTLQIGNGGTTGSIVGDVVNNAALAFNRSDNVSFGGLISGTGAVNQIGGGTLTLTGNNSYTGATNVNAGTLFVNGDQSAATGLTSVASGATLGGTGVIGGDVVMANGSTLAPGSNSTGTLTINGNLNLSSGTQLNFQFGQADMAGGALNDLVNVGGNLVLDGTINVSVPSGGVFGAGIYRVFNYDGTLTDNGLSLGTMPTGSNVTVQTSVGGQVNLVNSAGLALNFWDGADATNKNNGKIDGGDGFWQAHAGNNNWTNSDGTINAGYADDGFAIFSGAAGIVTVDNSLGAVGASGMQFATGGYLINGDSLALVGLESIIRVGDGTVAGAGMTATIDSVLTGNSKLVKTDAGTLVLSGTNTYMGGTAINGGTVRIASDGNLGAAAGGLSFDGGTLNTTANITTGRAVKLAGAGTLLTDAGTTLTLSGPVGGGGALTKSGTGILVLTGDATHTGGTTIAAGTLQVGNGGTSGSIIGNIVDNGALIFNRSNALLFAGSVSGTGTLTQNGAGTLTMTGNSTYAGTTAVNTGKLVLQSGGQINGTASLTVNAGGEMIVDGTGSHLVTGAGTSLIGSTSAGTLTVRNGGSASFAGLTMANAAGSSGTLNVVGSGSQITTSGASTFGSAGLATINILDGGKMISSGATTTVGGVAPLPAYAALVTVSGAGSQWDFVNSLQFRRGTMTVSNGGLVTAGTADIAYGSNSASADLLVTGAGSRFETSGALVISNASGTGTITIADGGVVKAGSGTLAMGSGNAALNIGGAEGNPAAHAGILDAASVTFGAANQRVNFNHDSSNYKFTAAISGAGSINHNGPGETVLTGANTYTGTTTINAGSLYINGNQSGATGLTTVNSGGTLGGKGTIGGSVVVANGGAINPGDLGTAPGTLTINGDLTLNGGSTLNYSFGQANVAGGPLNDLINVGGDLVLGGTLNVQTSGGGTFDPGIYRIINYAGTLTNNGLTIGTIPSSNFYVQTSINHQVNLVNTAGMALRYWDGADPANKNNGKIEGGDGNWQANAGGAGNDNWTEDGAANAPFEDAAFAVFMGATGTVTVDDSLGTVSAGGMQFLTDGYLIKGAPINLAGGASSVIRVGDGTTGGAGITATIASDLTGNTQLVKSDMGTLILTGTNSYTGGTAINGGTLQVAADANLGAASGGLSFNGGALHTTADITSSRNVTLTGTGTLRTDAGTTLTLDGAVAGAGALVKDGAGSLLLLGNAVHTGGTTIAQGTLQLGNGGTTGGLSGNVANEGLLVVDRSNSLNLDGVISGSGAFTQAGTGTTILAGANSYKGVTTVSGGTLLVNGDQSEATGTTTVTTGATLGGAGIIGGDVSIADGAALAPGSTATSAGTLAIKGDLSLASGSSLNMQFGEANVAGGAFNDLINVGGDLTLGGTLNVSVTPGGVFGAGIYRVINYGGTLTNNGLSLGAMPDDSDVFLQTSVGGQINLVNGFGLTLNYWDGDAGPKFDHKIAGGDGTWQNSLGNDNWTDAGGDINAAYANGSFAIFTAAAGTVTIDNSLGQVTASGMQFAVDGYRIEGGELVLDGSQASIRVGDGTSAGTAMTATIASVLSGSAELVKSDLGTLILTGVNTYTGGTLIQGGALQVAADTALGDQAGGLSFDGGALRTTADMTSDRSVTFTGAGTLLTDADTNLTLNGALSGAGAFNKAGNGTLVLTADSSAYSGSASVGAGTLVVNGVLGGSVSVASGGRLEGIGHVGATTNSGTIAAGLGGIGTLTVDGDYAGNGGRLEIATVLGDDTSATSRLVVKGSTSGTTQVSVSNRGGLGAQTIEGIKIIDVAGTSSGIFMLDGDYVFEGQQAVVAGAYGYRLYQGGVTTPNDGDWYLRSALLDGTDPGTPLYQPGVPLYESYAGSLQELNKPGTLQQRIGNRVWGTRQDGAQANAKGDRVTNNNGIWARIEAAHAKFEPNVSTSNANYDVNTWKFQTGIDGLLLQSEAGRFVGGLFVQYGTASSSVWSPYGVGSIDTSGYGLGATLTWYGENGFYVDGLAQVTWYDSDLRSATAGRKLVDGNGGVGYSLSIEAGQRIELGGNWSLTPQAQLSYSAVQFDDFTDVFGADVSLRTSRNLVSRFGMAVNHDVEWRDSEGRLASTHLYGIANVYYGFAGASKVDVADTAFSSRNDRLHGGIGVGGTLNWADDKYSLYGEAQLNTSLENFGNSNAIGGTIGFRMRW
ncbi:autotransporter outer membrane beta-barrel domain-containing protein [Mesorhizobium soli]|uniref:Autotransporter outer membrane beta-barrel domain-containing protein n=2 Tax=Pseudaminobacter soli (ex Li et al. 2025) TaxID=1295366 RepID=A0A2P7SLF4_9HYPH|nr:autotransporter outer membrane beta-barrel domain-containing protein [Mesorhizobium soli]